LLRPLRIGITIGLSSPNESLWINGIKQNALFLAKLFQSSPLSHDVLLLNTTNVRPDSRTEWDMRAFPTVQIDECSHDLDVLIELGGQISYAQTQRHKAKGGKLVSYCCGPEYVQNIEAMIFERRMWDSLFVNTEYDELWVIPQVAESSLHFLQTFRRCPARTVPFVWDPMALTSIASGYAFGGEYRPAGEPKRLTVIEPNIDVMKFCLYPILIAEQAFRQEPDRIGFLHVANADHFVHRNTEFASLMRHLDIVKANKASFIGRVKTPEFLAAYTDIVISHQWGLPLNYFYLECCWQGYPLIHNAELVKDLGYYYPGNDVAVATQALIHALRHHDEAWEAYRDEQRAGIQRFLAVNPELVARYDDLLFELCG
jgi:hypothetical protein